jgi:hypothetical protein
MDEYIHSENLALFRRRLAEATDEAARQILLKLLAEEEAKGINEPPSQPKAGGALNSPS